MKAAPDIATRTLPPLLVEHRAALTHGYLTVNLDIVWEVVRQNLPELDAAVCRMRRLERPE